VGPVILSPMTQRLLCFVTVPSVHQPSIPFDLPNLLWSRTRGTCEYVSFSLKDNLKEPSVVSKSTQMGRA